jgi:UDP-N-acetylglucosamine acyltransferase
VFREYATVHGGTKDGELTVLGDDNVILAYSHIAHDCIVGNRLIMSSQAALAGSCRVGDFVNIAWGTGVHQFCRIGSYAMVGAMSKVVQDVPPFMIADGNPSLIRGYNKVGLGRNGFGEEAMGRIRAAYKTIYRSGLNRTQALAALAADPSAESDETKALLEFIRSSERGICSGPTD